jgi:hypothetical protein
MARMVVEEVMAMADIVERGERGGEVEETEGEVAILTVGVMASLDERARVQESVLMMISSGIR